jgi:hypothetical protein
MAKYGEWNRKGETLVTPKSNRECGMIDWLLETLGNDDQARIGNHTNQRTLVSTPLKSYRG